MLLLLGSGHACAQSRAALDSVAMDLKTDREFNDRWLGSDPSALVADQDLLPDNDPPFPRVADPQGDLDGDRSPFEDRCVGCPGDNEADEPLAADERVVLDRQEDFERVFDDNKSAILKLCDAALRRATPIGDRPALLLTISASGQVTACKVVSAGYGTPGVASDSGASIEPSDVEDGDEAGVAASDPRRLVTT